jgi:hypothetical protein
MKHEHSLPHSQELAAGGYPEYIEFNPHPYGPMSLRSGLILYCHLHLSVPSGLFSSGLLTNFCIHFPCSSSLWYVLPISYTFFKCHSISWKVQIVNLLVMKSHRHLVISFLLGEYNLCNDLFLYSKFTLFLCLLMNGVIICVVACKLYETYCSRKVWYESCNKDISGKQNV